jgi:phosphoribosylanthranilate isomerase
LAQYPRLTIIFRTRIKFCGLVRQEDVLFAASLGVDALGLVFYPKSARFLSMDAALALRRTFPSYVACVGLFVNAEPALVQEHRNRLGLDIVQFHGDETMANIQPSIAELASGPRPSTPFWRALRVKPDSDLLELSAHYAAAEAVLLDAYSDGFGGAGQRFDWSLAKALPPERVVLSGGLDADSVVDAIASLAPFAVDVSSGIQSDHARAKSPERMELFVRAVQQADFLKVS